MIPDKKREEFDENTYLNQKNSQNILLFKKTLNYFISYEYREKVLDELAKLLNLESFVTSFYISEKKCSTRIFSDNKKIGFHFFLEF